MKVALVIPVFNHAASIARVIQDVRAASASAPEITEILIVDDGCTDGSSEIVQNIGNLTILVHPKNRGKGAALLTAFRYAQEHGFTHAVTIDADGQHDPNDIPRLLAAARPHSDDLIIGWRDMEASRTKTTGTIPTASKTGRDISRFWLRLETGQDIPDSQCGLRVYPLAHVLTCSYRFHRFDFETEVLARMAWAGLQIRSIPVACIYFSKAKRVSHFRPVVDTLRGIWMNTYLVARRLFPLPFPRAVGSPGAAPTFGRWWKIASWRAAVRQAMRAGNSNAELSAAFALGVLVGITPFYLLQTILVIYLARRLHLNILAAVIGSQISIPPLAPIWLALSYGTGNLLLHGQWLNLHSGVFSLQALPLLFAGSAVVSLCAAALALLAARIILSHVRPEPPLRRIPSVSSFPPAASTPITSPPP